MIQNERCHLCSQSVCILRNKIDRIKVWSEEAPFEQFGVSRIRVNQLETEKKKDKMEDK